MTCLALPPSSVESMDAVRRSLASAQTVAELFATAAALARTYGGHDRAAVLDIASGELRAEITDDLEHEASDALRRRVAASPIALGTGSLEDDLVRGAAPGRHATSVVEAELDLEAPVIIPITPDDFPLALLVADRPTGRTDPRGPLSVVAHLTALSLEALVLRTRVEELASEIRYMTASADALLHEVRHAPISLPRDQGQGLTFTHAGIMPGRLRADDGLLTPREREIMERVVSGRSNAEIAADLHLSADTVKTHVGRLLRKLGAKNRVAAVVAYLERQREAAS